MLSDRPQFWGKLQGDGHPDGKLKLNEHLFFDLITKLNFKNNR